MQSIAFFNNKGGVGKTTLLCNVAAYAALELDKSVCVIDADPQCNATQYFFNEDELENIYESDGFTISNIVQPLVEGEGFTEEIQTRRAANFGFDVLPGDPKLAMSEDFLAREWGDMKAGESRGIKSSLVFADMLKRLTEYDLVFIDVSPSLGAINRSILLASGYYMSPMSIDIFSLKAFENISEWIAEWEKDWKIGLNNTKNKDKIPDLQYGEAKFLGYVTQQYLAKKGADGKRRGVKAYEGIRSQIDKIIKDCGLDASIPEQPYEIGTVPNLFSLVPMSQSNNKPVFELQSSDGVVGAHFAKVKDSRKIFGDVTNNLLGRMK